MYQIMCRCRQNGMLTITYERLLFARKSTAFHVLRGQSIWIARTAFRLDLDFVLGASRTPELLCRR